MATDEGHQSPPSEGKKSSKASSITESPGISHTSLSADIPPQTDDNTTRDAPLLTNRTGTGTGTAKTQDEHWTNTSGDERDGTIGGGGEIEKEEHGREHGNHDLAKTETNMSIADTLSLPREILFVLIICFGQLFTRALLLSSPHPNTVRASSLGGSADTLKTQRPASVKQSASSIPSGLALTSRTPGS